MESPLEMLPADTMAVLEGKGLRRLAEVIGRDQLAVSLETVYGFAAQAMVQVFGYDILVPANMEAIGVDPDGSVGVGLLDIDRESFVAWATLADRGKFRDTVIASAARNNVELVTVPMGSAEMFVDKYSRLGVVLRDDVAMLVMSRPTKEGEVDYVRLMATVAPSQSLAASSKFKKATLGYAGQDALAFADVAALAQQAFSTKPPNMVSSASSQLQSARQSGAPAKEIQELEQRVAQDQAENDRWQARWKARADLRRHVFGGLSAIAMRFDVKRSGVMVESRAVLSEDEFPSSLLRNATGPAPLPGALSGRPMFLVAGTLDVDAFVDLVDRVLRGDGESWSVAVEGVRKELGVDLQADVRPLLTGQGGFAATLDGPPEFASSRGAPKTLGVSMHAQVRDGAKARALLATAASSFELDGVRPRKGRSPGVWEIAVPDWRTVHVGVFGDQFVVSTDAKFGARLQAGQAGDGLKATASSGAGTVLTLPDRSAVFGLDVGLVAAFTFLGMDNSMGLDVREPSVKSRAYRRKRRELQKVTEDIARLRSERANRMLRSWLRVVEPIGFTAVVARRAPDGLVAEGGQFVRAKSVADALEQVVLGGLELEAERTRSDDMDALWQKYHQLERELSEIREQDSRKLGGARKKRSRKP